MKKIKAFWKKLTRWQKWFFGLLIFLLFAGPASVLLTPPSPVDIYMAAPELEEPEQMMCEVDIRNFNVSALCGNSTYQYVKFTCADQYSSYIKRDLNNCLTVGALYKIAFEKCKQHPNCPSPSASLRPSPSPSPSPKPTLKPSYSPSPKYTPTPTRIPLPS